MSTPEYCFPLPATRGASEESAEINDERPSRPLPASANGRSRAASELGEFV